MPEHFVAFIFAVLSVIYLVLFARDYSRRESPGVTPRKAWLESV